MKHAKYYFKKHPKADVLYFTADDMAFTDANMAEEHAMVLEDDLVIPITRKEAMAAIKDIQELGWHAVLMEEEQL